MMKRATSVMSAMAMLLLACTESSEPIDPKWASTACDQCRMLISEPEFAAQILTSTGEHRYFDDIACMLSYIGQHPAKKLWVYHNGHWLVADDAHYADDARTPMGSGFHVKDDGPLDFTAIRAAHAAKHAK